MPTRADFYVGRGRGAEWVGSVAFDGYPDGIDLTSCERESVAGMKFPKHEKFPDGEHLFDATTEEQFRERLAAYFANRDDVTTPDHGWPWPWETSHTTDYAYAFDGGRVWASGFGRPWFDPREEEPEDDAPGPSPDFPDMSDRKRVTYGQRSGLIVFG